MQDSREPPDEGEGLLDSLAPLAENLAGGAAVDWEAADSSELTASNKVLLEQLRAIAQIASAHERFAREADVVLDPAAMGTGRAIAATVGRGELRTWGQLILRSYLGRGSFGDVYRAWDPRLDREVALKLLTPPATGEAARSSNVISEGRALARVRHPNVVTVYGADQIGGRIGVWMEFVEGRTLAQRIAADGPLMPAEMAAIGADLARALAAVHKAGLLHRDVKAQNVMCEAGGRNVLTDFGTAIPHLENEPAGGAGFEDTPAVDTPPSTITPQRATLAGTPLYLSPEVLDGAAQTPRSDIYALGVLLFHGVTGTFPVTGRTLREVHDRHREGQRTSLLEARPDLPLALVSVVDRALAPDPAARSQTADEMAAALDAVARDARAVQTGARGRRTRRIVAAAVAVAALGVAAWLAGVVPFRRTGTVAAKGPDLVLVASFENTSGDARAGQLVERAVREAVTRTRAFAVATPDRVNKVRGYMRRAPDSTLDATSAREAALRDGGIRAVITGSIAGPADRPAIEVRIVAPCVWSDHRHDQGCLSGRRDGAHARCTCGLASLARWMPNARSCRPLLPSTSTSPRRRSRRCAHTPRGGRSSRGTTVRAPPSCSCEPPSWILTSRLPTPGWAGAISIRIQRLTTTNSQRATNWRKRPHPRSACGRAAAISTV